MTRGFTAALGITLWIGQTVSWAGESADLTLPWSELAPAVTGKKVALVLPGGTHIEGKVREVATGGLRLRVSKTSDRNAVRKGDALIPRQSVSLLRVTGHRKLARILCTTGAVAASAIAVSAHGIEVYEGPAIIIVPAVTAVGTAGLGVAGYYIGKRIDRRVVNIRVLPE